MVRLLVTGDRHWSDRAFIANALQSVWLEYRHDQELVLIHGGANGADSIASEIASIMGFAIICEPAAWSLYGKRAGPIRNQLMLDLHRPNHCLAFHDDILHSRGTADMIWRAESYGLIVELLSHDQ